MLDVKLQVVMSPEPWVRKMAPPFSVALFPCETSQHSQTVADNLCGANEGHVGRIRFHVLDAMSHPP